MTSSASISTLPLLNAEELAHSQRVVEHIRGFMQQHGGVIGFDAWMRLALYAPGLGYYSAGAAVWERNNGALRLLPIRSSQASGVILPMGVG